MDPDDLQALEAQIREELSSLAALILGARESSRPVSLDEPIGRLSRMDAMQQQQMNEERGRMAERRVAALENALRRVALGTYGDCIACGEQIAVGRLRARPEVTLCAACQREQERD